jgi:hypothetical protein
VSAAYSGDNPPPACPDKGRYFEGKCMSVAKAQEILQGRPQLRTNNDFFKIVWALCKDHKHPCTEIRALLRPAMLVITNYEKQEIINLAEARERLAKAEDRLMKWAYKNYVEELERRDAWLSAP